MRVTTTCRLLFAGVLVASACGARVSRAALDPAHADTDVRALRTAGSDAFCQSPGRPLSLSARELCPLASEIDGCQPLVAACEEDALALPRFGGSWASALARLAQAGIWLVVALGIGAIALLVVAAVRNGIRDRTVGDTPRPERAKPGSVLSPLEAGDAETLLRHAAGLTSEGRFDAALFAYMSAALSALDQRGAIRITRHTTHGEYVRTCTEDAARPMLRALARDVDTVQFGRARVSPEMIARARVQAEGVVFVRTSILSTAARAATMLVVLCTASCALGSFAPGSDPAGHDILLSLLQRQGAEASRMSTSLEALPLRGTKGPTVIVDLEETAMDEETTAHLVRWVEQGGRLVLAGKPGDWPSEMEAHVVTGVTTREMIVETTSRELASCRTNRAKLAQSAAIEWPSDDRASVRARLESGELYGGVRHIGLGTVLGIAGHDLLTNAGLSVPGNASALLALLASVDAVVGKNAFLVARAENGIAPPSNPVASLRRIGLGPAMLQALLFAAILFLAVGIRQAKPRPETPPRRQAFAEHVEATGALYARTHAASHALGAYARYADERLRAKMPRGADPAAFLALRAGADAADTAALYARALAARADIPGRGDELLTLARLSALYATAMRGDSD